MSLEIDRAPLQKLIINFRQILMYLQRARLENTDGNGNSRRSKTISSIEPVRRNYFLREQFTLHENIDGLTGAEGVIIFSFFDRSLIISIKTSLNRRIAFEFFIRRLQEDVRII